MSAVSINHSKSSPFAEQLDKALLNDNHGMRFGIGAVSALKRTYEVCSQERK